MTDQVKILFVDGSYVDFNKPANFNLPEFVHGARSLGFIISTGFYIPMHMVKAIMLLGAEGITFGTGGPPTQTAPGTETKQ